jgi:hypothetical protein
MQVGPVLVSPSVGGSHLTALCAWHAVHMASYFIGCNMPAEIFVMGTVSISGTHAHTPLHTCTHYDSEVVVA